MAKLSAAIFRMAKYQRVGNIKHCVSDVMENKPHGLANRCVHH
jgi:hypothetical protein